MLLLYLVADLLCFCCKNNNLLLLLYLLADLQCLKKCCCCNILLLLQHFVVVKKIRIFFAFFCLLISTPKIIHLQLSFAFFFINNYARGRSPTRRTRCGTDQTRPLDRLLKQLILCALQNASPSTIIEMKSGWNS